MNLKNLNVNAQGNYNGYCLFEHVDGIELRVYDMDQEIESLSSSLKGESVSHNVIDIKREDLDLDTYFCNNKDLYEHIKKVDSQQRWSDLMDIICYDLPEGISCQEAMKMVWAYERKQLMKEGKYSPEFDIMPYYIEQNELREKIRTDIRLDLEGLELIAGCDVSYSEEDNQMVGAIVVLNARTLEVVDQAWHQMEISFPYIPGLFSYREVPPLLEAFKKLEKIPEVIVCDAHGIAHPRGIGMASHLGVVLDIPTIGCAKKRLVGSFDKGKLGVDKGCSEPIKWAGKEVGVALRTRSEVKPVFVSVGHKIDLDSSIGLVLKLCDKYRLPETTRQADQIVNGLLRSRKEIDFMNDDQPD